MKNTEPTWHASASLKDKTRTTMIERHHLDGKITMDELADYIHEHAPESVMYDQIMVNASLVWERPTTPEEIAYFAEGDRKQQERTDAYRRRIVRVMEEEYGTDRDAWPRASDEEWSQYQADRARMMSR